jgi:hypothetical protein
METQEEYKDLATRHNEGKLKWSLVDFKSLEPMVRVLEFGANKYEIDNWKKGLKVTEVCESLLRHIHSFMAGENDDSESGLPHVGHIQVNAMFLSYMINDKPEMDDRRIDNYSEVRKLTRTLNSYTTISETVRKLREYGIKKTAENPNTNLGRYVKMKEPMGGHHVSNLGNNT